MASLGSPEAIVAHFKKRIFRPETQLEKDIHTAAEKLEEEGKRSRLERYSKSCSAKDINRVILQRMSPFSNGKKESRNKLKSLPEDVKRLWSHHDNSAPSEAVNFLSIQRYVSDCDSLSTLSPDSRDLLPIEEVHKMFIDVIFFNTDRHTGNILYSRATKKLYLIDHGACLPRPLEHAEGLTQSRFEFVLLPQCASHYVIPLQQLSQN